MQTTLIYRLFLLFLMTALMPVSGNAQSTQFDNDQPAIGGYSPVSYFTKDIAERGSAEFAVEHEGNTYYLASAEQVELFTENPAKYRPRYTVCPYSLTLGELCL